MSEKIKQLEMPEVGEEICIIHTSSGDIKLRFFENLTPNTAENFKTHAEENYYNGCEFFRTINNFMIQGGDPTNSGRGGESIWGGNFKDEFSDELKHYRGALSMANAGPNTNGSQFFIVQSSSIPQEHLDYFKLTGKVREEYARLGGTPHLDGKHSVFGQVFEGMDVVDKIASKKTDRYDHPYESDLIEGIEFVKYE